MVYFTFLSIQFAALVNGEFRTQVSRNNYLRFGIYFSGDVNVEVSCLHIGSGKPVGEADHPPS